MFALQIAGFPNYEVSPCGHIKRCTHVRTDKNGKTYLIQAKVLRGTVCKDGYRKVHLTHNRKSKTLFVHRIVALTYLDNPDFKRTVNHINGDKLDNRVINLEWATDKENVRHAVEIGKIRNDGIRNSQAKLNIIEVKTIKKLKGILPQSQVAEMFGISKGHVSNIQRGYNWWKV